MRGLKDAGINWKDAGINLKDREIKTPSGEQKGHYYEQSWRPAKIPSNIHQKRRSDYARSAELAGLRSGDARSYAPIDHL